MRERPGGTLLVRMSLENLKMKICRSASKRIRINFTTNRIGDEENEGSF